MELEVHELLSSYEFPGDDIPFISSSALLALEALMANPNIKRDENNWVDKIFELMYAVDNCIPIRQRQTDLPFLLTIEDGFSITGHATVGLLPLAELSMACIQKADIQRGMVLAKPGTITPHTKFFAIVYILKEEEDWRHSPFFSGYRSQFYMRTIDITSKVTTIKNDKDEEAKMVMPGECVNMEVEFILPVTCEQGMWFAIREGGKTFGAGVNQSIVE
ncbi:hypothetical protein ZIOFF_029741 [Zingiber officinale]|uniref:Translation elongation factor EFTu/EF1A C-terminal domain-containing protein n=1 Tax=Zingiber officinale TaxID=94328 RepID=A0A8J5LB41_ZINOF|nr:hypothetical protein ZIOFF_029741 [Zingiber officinale]